MRIDREGNVICLERLEGKAGYKSNIFHCRRAYKCTIRIMIFIAGKSVCQVDGCLHFGIKRKNYGWQLLSSGGPEHPFIFENEKQDSCSPGSFWSRKHGHETRVLRLPALCKEIQVQTGTAKGLGREMALVGVDEILARVIHVAGEKQPKDLGFETVTWLH